MTGDWGGAAAPERAAHVVTVHDLEGACAALRAGGARGAAVVLLSAPGAALYGGALWWRALVTAAERDAGGACADVLDCADATGYAFAALRAGCRTLVLDPAAPGFAAAAAAAASLGAVILPQRPAEADPGRRR